MESGLGCNVIPANPDAGGVISLFGSGDPSVDIETGDIGDTRVAMPDPGACWFD